MSSERHVDVLEQLEIYAHRLRREVWEREVARTNFEGYESGRDSLDMYTLTDALRRSIEKVRDGRRLSGLPDRILMPEIPLEQVYPHPLFDFYPKTRKVVIDGKSRRLTPNEAKLLQLLAANENITVTHGMIGARIFNDEGWNNSFGVKTYISHLRKKLPREVLPGVELLQSFINTGYVLYNAASPSFEVVRATLAKKASVAL